MSKYLIVVVTTAQLTSKPGQRCANVLVEKSVPGGFRNLNLWFFCLIQLLLYKDHFHLLEITFLMPLIFGTKHKSHNYNSNIEMIRFLVH